MASLPSVTFYLTEYVLLYFCPGSGNIAFNKRSSICINGKQQLGGATLFVEKLTVLERTDR